MAPRVLFLSVLAAVLAGLGAGCSAGPVPEAADQGRNGAEHPSSMTTAPTDALSVQVSQLDLERLAKNVLEEVYGDSERDEALDCWRDEAADEPAYCMRLSEVRQVEEAGHSVLYVLASNVNRFDLPDYQYAHTDPGRVAAFAALINPDGSLGGRLASGGAFSFGSNGNCGCDDAVLVRLGAEKHAWHFVSGGVWQGIVVTNHALLSREGETFVDVSEIPEISEGDQSHRFSISVDESDRGLNAFPLIVTKRTVVEAAAANPSIEGEEVARWVVRPSEIDGVYRLADAGAAPLRAGDRP